MYLQSTSCGEIGLILHNILYKILGYKTDGVFVEVGANDGFTGSFTYNLAEIGWHGIYCEPVPRIYEQCINNHLNHKNVVVLNTAVGEKKDIAKIVDGGPLSTMDFDTYNIYTKIDWAKNSFINSTTYMVNVEKLDIILENNKVKPGLDLFILDVEGFEENVLKGFSIEKYSPKIVVIEISDQHPNFIHNEKCMQKFSNLRKYFSDNKYSLLVNDVVDNVYIRNDLFDKNDRKLFAHNIKFSQFSK